MARVRRQGRRTHDAPNERVIPPAAMSDASGGRSIRVRSRRDLRSARRRRRHRCWDHLIAAPLWPLHGANLGTLLRTCDAVGACIAVPRWPWVREALGRGNTLRTPGCVHWVNDPPGWLVRQRDAGSHVLGVELAEDAVRLADLPM